MCSFIDNIVTMASSFINNTVIPVNGSRRSHTTGYSHPSYLPTSNMCHRHHYQVTQSLPACQLNSPSRRQAPSDLNPPRYQPQVQTHHLGKIYGNHQRAVDPILGMVQQLNCPLHPIMPSRSYDRAMHSPAFLAVPYRETEQAAPSRSTATMPVRAPEWVQVARTRPQATHHQTVSHRTTSPAAQHHIQYRTTRAGINYSTQPAVDRGLGNFYQINCMPQIIRRDSRGEPQQIAQSCCSTMPQITRHQTAPYRATAPAAPSPSSIVSRTYRSAAVPQANIIRILPTNHQRELYVSNQLKISRAIERMIQDRKPNDRELITMMRGLFRQEELEKIADRKAAQREAQQQLLPAHQRQTIDRLETRLSYHIALQERLQLPTESRLMNLSNTVSMSQQELQQAGDKILRLEKLDSNSLIDFIIQNGFWQRYFEKHYQALQDQDHSIARYTTLMEQLEEENEQGKMNENEYVQRCNQLKQERQTAIKAWYRAKSHELIHRQLMTEQYQPPLTDAYSYPANGAAWVYSNTGGSLANRLF